MTEDESFSYEYIKTYIILLQVYNILYITPGTFQGGLYTQPHVLGSPQDGLLLQSTILIFIQIIVTKQIKFQQ